MNWYELKRTVMICTTSFSRAQMLFTTRNLHVTFFTHSCFTIVPMLKKMKKKKKEQKEEEEEEQKKKKKEKKKESAAVCLSALAVGGSKRVD